MVHAAIAGMFKNKCIIAFASNSHEAGIELTGDDFNRIHRKIPYILNLRPSGFYPAQYYYYAGGTPAIMEAIKEHLHLDVMTVTGKTLGENLKELKCNGYYEKCYAFLKDIHVKREDIIYPITQPLMKKVQLPY